MCRHLSSRTASLQREGAQEEEEEKEEDIRQHRSRDTQFIAHCSMTSEGFSQAAQSVYVLVIDGRRRLVNVDDDDDGGHTNIWLSSDSGPQIIKQQKFPLEDSDILTAVPLLKCIQE
ncbi:hypothetical protein TYRP_017482 [Tyrophagus putrescentiae]|nr:hypothetical protein TYRP_017482 [Tyrophagus putrescentiae]